MVINIDKIDNILIKILLLAIGIDTKFGKNYFEGKNTNGIHQNCVLQVPYHILIYTCNILN